MNKNNELVGDAAYIFKDSISFKRWPIAKRISKMKAF
jgi:hypothetical protein